MNNRFTQTTFAITAGLVIGLGVQAVMAWTAPTAPPPDGNVNGPITTSENAQVKDGKLVVNGGWMNGTVPTADPIGMVVMNGKIGFGMDPVTAPTSDVRVEVAGKIVSNSTQASDAGNTVVTKDYVDAQGGGTNNLVCVPSGDCPSIIGYDTHKSRSVCCYTPENKAGKIRTAFRTQSEFTMKTKTVDDADDLCQAEASAAGLSGTFKAVYLSDSQRSLFDKFGKDTAKVIDVDGADLQYRYDTGLFNATSKKADGLDVGPVERIWTNISMHGLNANLTTDGLTSDKVCEPGKGGPYLYSTTWWLCENSNAHGLSYGNGPNYNLVCNESIGEVCSTGLMCASI